MNLGLENKFALITGGSRGIGKGIARSLANEGTKLAIVSRNAGDVDALIKELGGSAAGHLGLSMDLVEEGAPLELVNKLQEVGFGPLDICVHNVGGTLDISDPFCSIEDWRKVYRFNFEVAVELNTLIVPGMQERKWGRVVHNSSIASMENQGPVTYCSIKAALTAYTRSFGGVVAPDGVVISAILPGAVYTEGGYWDKTSKERPEHVEKYLSERQRIGRFGDIQEIGDYVAFLCSEKASFNTGSIVPIDGGQGRGYFGQ